MMHGKHQLLEHRGAEKYLVYPSTDSIYPPHWHEALEIVYALDNGIGIMIDNREVKLMAGDIALVNSQEIHSFQQQAHPLRRYIIQIETDFNEIFSHEITCGRFTENLIKGEEDIENGINILHQRSDRDDF